MFWAYILHCVDNSYYTGHTDDLERRLAQHNLGTLPCYTRKRRPLRLVYSQEFETRIEALSAERQIKGWSRAKKEALSAKDWKAVGRLARGKHRHQRYREE